jgi:16S rRNA (guanine527-N7)-methyltransferase
MSARTRRRLAELAERFDLPRDAVAGLGALLELLATDPTAPTKITDPGEAVDAHVADALVALELDEVRRARRIADIGSGAGFPGLVLAAALPSAKVALVESATKKCAFLDRAVEAMGLENVSAVASRAEEWTAGRGRHDLVTARAVAPLNVLAEYAAPLLADGGALVAWKGRRDASEEADGDAAAAATGLAPALVRSVRPWSGAEHLHLHLYVKVGRTPPRYPRRAGMASKRPVRAST